MHWHTNGKIDDGRLCIAMQKLAAPKSGGHLTIEHMASLLVQKSCGHHSNMRRLRKGIIMLSYAYLQEAIGLPW
jgi:hypothetical protein